MKEVSFVLQFKGGATVVSQSPMTLRAKTTASSETFNTRISTEGVQSGLDVGGGGQATFESEVVVAGEGTFQESGTMTFGDRTGSKLTFNTVGQGHIGPSGIPNLQRGAVIWQVTGGTGQFAGATGLITSNFTVGAAGEVVDNQFYLLFLPG